MSKNRMSSKEVLRDSEGVKMQKYTRDELLNMLKRKVNSLADDNARLQANIQFLKFHINGKFGICNTSNPIEEELVNEFCIDYYDNLTTSQTLTVMGYRICDFRLKLKKSYKPDDIFIIKNNNFVYSENEDEPIFLIYGREVTLLSYDKIKLAFDQDMRDASSLLERYKIDDKLDFNKINKGNINIVNKILTSYYKAKAASSKLTVFTEEDTFMIIHYGDGTDIWADSNGIILRIDKPTLSNIPEEYIFKKPQSTDTKKQYGEVIKMDRKRD